MEAYEKAYDVLNQHNRSPHLEEIKPELANNIGVLKMKMEKYEEALVFLQKAHDICIKSEEPRMENGRCKVFFCEIMFFIFFF